MIDFLYTMWHVENETVILEAPNIFFGNTLRSVNVIFEEKLINQFLPTTPSCLKSEMKIVPP